jgi:hypothetical protein
VGKNQNVCNNVGKYKELILFFLRIQKFKFCFKVFYVKFNREDALSTNICPQPDLACSTESETIET